MQRELYVQGYWTANVYSDHKLVLLVTFTVNIKKDCDPNTDLWWGSSV